jgi:hypothetical protein
MSVTCRINEVWLKSEIQIGYQVLQTWMDSFETWFAGIVLLFVPCYTQLKFLIKVFNALEICLD